MSSQPSATATGPASAPAAAHTPESLRALFPVAGQPLPEAAHAFAPIEQRTCLIDGKLEEWPGEMQQVFSPIGEVDATDGKGGFTPRLLGSCPILDEAAALRAVDAADRAWADGMGAWPTMGVAERIRHVEDFARRMAARRTEVVRIMMWEICKSWQDASGEFDRTMEYLRDTIDALKDLDRASSRFVIEKGIYAQIRRAPLGPVLCMGPYNYPLNETFCTLMPALIMGNPVIVKTPRLGRLLYSPLMEAFRDAFPAGVVNILHGDRRIVKPIMASGRINVLAFIGSSTAADALRLAHPHPHRLRCVLGLDAKNAGIVLDCADMDLTVAEALQGSFSFNGQRCTALKMLFVHQKRLDEFLARMDEGIRKLRIGMPWDEGVRITPLPVPGKSAYLDDLVRDAAAHGGRVVNSGGGTHAETLYHPTVVCPATQQMRVYHEEQFGPVIPVIPFTDIETPVRYVVGSQYGQQLSIFGNDPDDVARLIDPMVNQVCRVNINSQCQRGPDTFPFTGRKDSAEGTLSVSDALRCFSIRTLVAAKGSDANKEILTSIIRDRRSNFLSNDFIL